MRYHAETKLMRARQQLDLLFHRQNNYGPTNEVACPCEHQPGRFRKRKPFACSCSTCRRDGWQRKEGNRRLLRAQDRDEVREQLEDAMPRDEQNRFVCTKDDPWSEEKGRPAIHPDAEQGEDRDFGGGEYCESYTCPHCGKRFYVELPQ